MIKCPACSYSNQDGSAYCEECGTKLFSKQAQPTEPSLQSVAGKVEAAAGSAANEVVAQLAIEGVVFPLSRNYNSIGRRSPADGVYPDVDLTDFDHDSYISRRHAQIIRENGQFFFEDLGSSNGSYLNGELMVKGSRKLLNESDLLKLGKTEVIFSIKK